MNKDQNLYGFNLTRPISADWSNPVSVEGLKDAITDLFSLSYTTKDLVHAENTSKTLQEALGATFKSGEEIHPVNSKESILRFYTKNGRIIESLSHELQRQIHSLGVLTRVIKELTKSISRSNKSADEIEILTHINDAELLPLFSAVSRLSFLDSIYIKFIKEAHIDNLEVQTLQKTVPLRKQSFFSTWLEGLFRGERVKVQIEKANQVFKTRYDKIYEASAIKESEFLTLTKDLMYQSEDLVEAVKAFTLIDQAYKHSSNSLLRLMLRNARSLSTIGLRVVQSQGRFYSGIMREL